MIVHERGLVIGKFYPWHAGHVNLVRTAIASCRHVVVQVLASSAESTAMEVRAEWIRKELPMVEVVTALDDEPVDYDDPDAWDAHMRIVESLLDAPVDAVFTSDDYGAELARRLSATWVQVEPRRQLLGLSGTRVRADVEGHWWALPPAVRSDLVRRVVVLGAESTGTTTLAEALGERLGVPVVEEFGRRWSMERPGGLEAAWHTAEFDLVAARQSQMEDTAAALTPRPYLVCDTDVLATAVWHERYVGHASPTVLAEARRRRPDLYLLTSDDVPFVQDGWRDGEHLRGWMTGRFREVLIEAGVRWDELRGDLDTRLARALALVEEVGPPRFTEPLPQQGGEVYR